MIHTHLNQHQMMIKEVVHNFNKQKSPTSHQHLDCGDICVVLVILNRELRIRPVPIGKCGGKCELNPHTPVNIGLLRPSSRSLTWTRCALPSLVIRASLSASIVALG